MIFKIYQQHIFPHLLNQVMQSPSLMQARGQLLSGVKGDCLEIGFGTGLNLNFYQNISHLYGLEPSEKLWQLAQARLEQSAFEIEPIIASAEAIPLPSESVENIVSTWTLCSIAQIDLALQEIHRVLQKQGVFHFIEHVLSDVQSTQRWQNTLNPVQKKLADGCHLNRDIEQLLLKHGFEFIEKTYFDAKGIPSIGKRMLLGRVKRIDT